MREGRPENGATLTKKKKKDQVYPGLRRELFSHLLMSFIFFSFFVFKTKRNTRAGSKAKHAASLFLFSFLFIHF